MAPHEVCDFSLDQTMRPCEAAGKWFFSSVQFADITGGVFYFIFLPKLLSIGRQTVASSF